MLWDRQDSRFMIISSLKNNNSRRMITLHNGGASGRALTVKGQQVTELDKYNTTSVWSRGSHGAVSKAKLDVAGLSAAQPENPHTDWVATILNQGSLHTAGVVTVLNC